MLTNQRSQEIVEIFRIYSRKWNLGCSCRHHVIILEKAASIEGCHLPYDQQLLYVVKSHYEGWR